MALPVHTVQAFLDLIVVDDKTCTSAGCSCGGIVVYPEGSLGHGDRSIVDLTICGCQLTLAEDVGPWDGDSTLGRTAGTSSSTNACPCNGWTYLEALGREDSSAKSLILTDANHYVLAIQFLWGGTPRDKLVWLFALCMVHSTQFHYEKQYRTL